MEGVKECRIERWLDDEGGWERTDIRVGCGIEGRRDEIGRASWRERV